MNFISMPERIDSPSEIHMAARRDWNERYGVYMQQARCWRYAAFGSMAVTCVAVGACAWMSIQSRVVPYIVEVNKLGDALAISRAGIEPKISEKIIRGDIARWVQDVKTVSTDNTAERTMLREAAAMTDVNGTALGKLKDWLEANNPSKLSADKEVDVTVLSVLPLSESTWRVEWQEDVRNVGGMPSSVHNWNANITVSIKTPITDAQVLANPAGVYVKSFEWGERP